MRTLFSMIAVGLGCSLGHSSLASAQANEEGRYGPPLGAQNHEGQGGRRYSQQGQPLPEPLPAAQSAPYSTEAPDAAHNAQGSAAQGYAPSANYGLQEPMAGRSMQSNTILNKFKLGLDLSVLGYESQTIGVGDLIELELESSSFMVGLTPVAGIGASAGYGLTEQLVLTGRLVVMYSSTSAGEGESRSKFEARLTPGIEYVFEPPSKSMRPFIGGLVGLLVAKLPMATGEADELSFTVGAQGGVHWFANEHVSIDPSLLVLYRVGSASVEGPANLSVDVSGFAIALLVGISYWS